MRNDKGGHIVRYALTRAKWQSAGTRVRFSGVCASACTLYLALPPKQLCLEPSARFKFHVPLSKTAEATREAKAYLLASYPDWVRDWIGRQGGLRRDFIVMPNEYARRHLPACGEARAGQKLPAQFRS